MIWVLSKQLEDVIKVMSTLDVYTLTQEEKGRILHSNSPSYPMFIQLAKSPLPQECRSRKASFLQENNQEGIIIFIVVVVVDAFFRRKLFRQEMTGLHLPKEEEKEWEIPV